MQYQNLWGSAHFWKFDDVSELISETEKAFRWAPMGKWKTKRHNQNRNSEFTGSYSIESLEDAIAESRQPWAEGIAIYDALLEKVHEHHVRPPMSARRIASWSEDHGDEINLDRLRADQPYWRSTERASRRGPQTVTITINLGARHDFPPEWLIWKGVACIALAELLEGAGYRVELWGARWGQGAYNEKTEWIDDDTKDYERWSHAYAVCLKRASDPIDASTLINTISPWFYRTVGLASLALGYSVGMTPKEHCGESRMVDVLSYSLSGDLLRFVCNGCFDEDSAIEWIKECLSRMEYILNPPPVSYEETKEEITISPEAEVKNDKPIKKVKRREIHDA